MIQFGDFKISFKELRKLILQKKREFELPNHEIAVIPEEWFEKYGEFFAFLENHHDKLDKLTLRKHHLALVSDLERGQLAKVSISNKLQKLKQFEFIEEHPLPTEFKGKLRPYQKAGFNWLHFLNHYNFGGCLADDMGLGKTVQTLAMLQSQKEQFNSNPSLLIMPTSLIYHWVIEANKFTPQLNLLVYTGTKRNKDVDLFQKI